MFTGLCQHLAGAIIISLLSLCTSIGHVRHLSESAPHHGGGSGPGTAPWGAVGQLGRLSRVQGDLQ